MLLRIESLFILRNAKHVDSSLCGERSEVCNIHLSRCEVYCTCNTVEDTFPSRGLSDPSDVDSVVQKISDVDSVVQKIYRQNDSKEAKEPEA